MWRPLFVYYFLLIATMTKTMFVNSQQLLSIILFLCELITLHKIHMISLFPFYLFLFSFIHLGSWQNNQALDSTLIFIIYSSRTRLHRRIIKQNSKLDHTKAFVLLDRDIKDWTKKNGKDKSDGDTIPGHSPKLGSCQGECPYPMLSSSLLVKKVELLMMDNHTSSVGGLLTCG